MTAERRRSCTADDRGITLVEQLIVTALLGGLALLVATVTIDLSRGAEGHRQRVDLLHQQQLALEIVTKDLRAADPLISSTPLLCEPSRQPATTPAVASCANALGLEPTRRGVRWRITYGYSSGSLTQVRQSWNGTGWSAATSTVLARGLLNGAPPSSPVFALSDAAGKPTGTAADVTRVDALLVGRNPRSGAPLPLSAQVSLRNRVSRSTG